MLRSYMHIKAAQTNRSTAGTDRESKLNTTVTADM